MLTIKTLGTFDVLYNGHSLTNGFDPRRGLLLVYLLEQGGVVERSTIADLLWPNAESSLRLNSLRVLLSRMRHHGEYSILEASRTKLTLAEGMLVDYDAAQIRVVGRQVSTADESALRSAADLYQGAFLSACVLDHFPILDEWASAVRAEVEMITVRIFERLIPLMLVSDSDPEMTVHYAKQLADLVPEDDVSQAFYLQALKANGQVAQAIQQFAAYRRSLPPEREVSRELIKLVAQLSQPNYKPWLELEHQTTPTHVLDPGELATVSTVKNWHSFPFIEHPIIGREEETRQLLSQLDGGHRLISIVGIGGTGKTFFVRSQHKQLQERFDKAIYYVDLRSAAAQPDQETNTLLLAISDALNLTVPIFEQITAMLRQSKCCLILDNFETVRSAALLVLELLKSAPQLTVLVTSRERLNLSTESIISLGGLSWQVHQASVEQATDQLAPKSLAFSEKENAAVQYFLQCAQRQDIYYTINDEKRLWIEQICRKVDGLPLALELTAMQLPFFNLPELVDQISVNQSVLRGDIGDLPGDHYSVWAVLDSMWQTLSETERQVLAELSVFAGAFHREAMMNVTPAERSIYTRLLNTSLLRTEDPAWFSLHPLVKQYAAQRLTSDEARQRHARYFLEMFAGGVRMREGLVTQQLPVPRLAIRYHADSAPAWQWAVDNAEWELLDRALLRLSRYLDVTYQIQELVQHMKQLLDALPPFQERDQLQHRLAGRAAYNLTNYKQWSDVSMEFWWERSLSWLEAARDPWDLAAAVLTYADTLFSHSRSWDRIESLLAQAKSLIDQYPEQLDPLRIVYDFTACTYFLYQGEWENLRDVQKALVMRMAHPAHSTTFADHLLYATCLDDWTQAYWLIERLEMDNKDNPALSTWQQWAAHHLCNAAANAGDITGAIAQRLSILDGYVHVSEQLLPLPYAELALWQHLAGDAAAAEASAAKVLAYAHQQVDRLYFAFGQLLVGTFYSLKGDHARAIPLLHTVLDFGREIHHPTMIFSALYYLAQIHADQLPTELVERILKIGAVSPAMYFALRPLARQHLTAQGVVIADEERETLWATDMKTVEALLDEVMKRIA